MDYEIVHLEEKTVVGLSARTNNMDPGMGAVIGGLWERFYGAGVWSAIQNKSSGKSLGIYMDYDGDEKADYTILVACEVSGPCDLQQGTIERKIPAGEYAKFIVKGDVHRAAADFWQELWKMDLPRSFVCDFEEYQNSDMEQAEIHIYIGLKKTDGR